MTEQQKIDHINRQTDTINGESRGTAFVAYFENER